MKFCGASIETHGVVCVCVLSLCWRRPSSGARTSDTSESMSAMGPGISEPYVRRYHCAPYLTSRNVSLCVCDTWRVVFSGAIRAHEIVSSASASRRLSEWNGNEGDIRGRRPMTPLPPSKGWMRRKDSSPPLRPPRRRPLPHHPHPHRRRR